ncbi:MAG: MarR family winged helix-turn-helix transcriptional regulator [Armatimonadota bacterium]
MSVNLAIEDKCSAARAELIADIFIHAVRKATASAICCDEQQEDITPSLMQCMEYIYSQGSSTIGQIATGLGISVSGASQLVDRLVKKGLAQRSEHELDRRRTQVLLTEFGSTLVRETRRRRSEWFASILRAMPPKDRESFVAGLQSFLQIALDIGKKLDRPCTRCPVEHTCDCISGQS